MEIISQIRKALEGQIKNGLVANADQYDRGEMAYVAALLALSSTGPQPFETVRALWPFTDQIFRPTYGRDDLVEAAALLIGEIIRVDAAAEKARWKPTHRALEGTYLVRLIGPASRQKEPSDSLMIYEDIEGELFYCHPDDFESRFACLVNDDVEQV